MDHAGSGVCEEPGSQEWFRQGWFSPGSDNSVSLLLPQICYPFRIDWYDATSEEKSATWVNGKFVQVKTTLFCVTSTSFVHFINVNSRIRGLEKMTDSTYPNRRRIRHFLQTICRRNVKMVRHLLAEGQQLFTVNVRCCISSCASNLKVPRWPPTLPL